MTTVYNDDACIRRESGGGSGEGVPDGGLTNQVLTKQSDYNGDVDWQTITKSSVGLANVDNTSDSSKPLSDAAITSRDDLQTQILTLTAAVGVATTIAARTLVGLTAITSLPANSLGYVTNDSTASNNGVYQWNGTVWTKSTYDPVSVAAAYTDQSFEIVYSKNLYNSANNSANSVVDSGTGAVTTVSGWECSGAIPVTVGQAYTLSWLGTRRVGLAFYTVGGSVVASSYNGGGTNPITVTAPATAATMRFNLHDNVTAAPTSVQLEAGSTATAYVAYTAPARKLKDVAVPSSVIVESEVPALVAKPYEETIVFKNLFDLTRVVVGKMIDSGSGNLVTVAGWGSSHYIPVVAGQQYTISGTRSRQGLSFFASGTTTTCLAGSYNGTATLPLTVTAPAGANFMIINLYTSTAATYSNMQVEAGALVTAYEGASGTRKMVKAADIYPPIGSGGFDATLSVSGTNTASVTTRISPTMTLRNDLVISKTVTHDQSSVFNFSADYVNNVLLRNLGDDVSPIRAFGTTIGANHGYNKTLVTLSGHGKTNLDVGSVWSDGTKQWVIVEIVSASQFSITARLDNTAFVSGTLTHVSGATNTTSVTPTAAATSQWYPVFRNRSLTCAVDGVAIDLSVIANYGYKTSATFMESYDMMSKTDIVEWLILNGTVAVVNYNAAASVAMSTSYRFDTHGGCTVTTDFCALKAVSAFQDAIFTQSVKMETTGGTVYFYVPKTLPFTHETVNYDFTQLTTLDSTTLATRIDFTPARCVATGQLADRVLQLNTTVGYATGYLPTLDADPSVRRTNASNKAIQISEIKKTYPSCIDTTAKTSLAVGDYFRVVAYRNYFERSGNRTASYVVESGQGDYLYLDYHSAHANTVDRIVLPQKFHGKTITVNEKSANVTMLSNIVTGSIAVRVGTYSNSTYAVLKLN